MAAARTGTQGRAGTRTRAGRSLPHRFRSSLIGCRRTDLRSWGRRLPLRGQSPASTERFKGAYGVAARSAAPTLDPLRSGLRAGSYEEGDSGNGHEARGRRIRILLTPVLTTVLDRRGWIWTGPRLNSRSKDDCGRPWTSLILLRIRR